MPLLTSIVGYEPHIKYLRDFLEKNQIRTTITSQGQELLVSTDVRSIIDSLASCTNLYIKSLSIRGVKIEIDNK